MVRKLIVVTAAALVSIGLAGCRTNVGTAASVDGKRISDSDVTRYVTPKGPSAAVVSQAKTQGQEIAPKSEVLQYLVAEQVFRATLADNGGVPTATQLTAVEDDAAKLLLQTQLTGSALHKALVQGLARSGIRAAFTDRFLKVQELEYTLIKRNNLQQLSQLTALIDKTKPGVSVSSRYGRWDPESLQLTRDGATPSFLKLQPTPGVSSAASQANGGGS